MAAEDTTRRTPSAKVVDIDQLATAVAAARAVGQRVVHCHGVFDLLHIGHLRYLAGARALGDLLVVTLTPDVWVNKGPLRPAFGEQLRAEALAALECVDLVAVNRWPTAVETVQAIRPDIYAKGGEYRDKRTPEIIAEEAAVTALGAQMAYVDDLRSSSSHLLNRHFSPFDDETQEYLLRLSENHATPSLLAWLERAADLRLLVVGETMIDEHVFVQATGRSPRAAVATMRLLTSERWLGAAAALANHLAAFCAKVSLVSLVGAEDAEERWALKHLQPGIKAHFLRKAGAPTPLTRRYRETYFGTPVFEVCRVDEEPLTASDEGWLLDRLDHLLPQHDAVIVADYGHSLLTAAAIGRIARQARHLSLHVQAQGTNVGYLSTAHYPRADYVCLTEQDLRLDCHSPYGELRTLLPLVAGRLRASVAMVTRGKHGCLAHSGESFNEAPAVATQVVDRTGASEAFVALSALAAAQGAPLEVVAFLGNVAAAEVVSSAYGPQPLQKLRLTRSIESLLR
ncbi:MAG: adenylyltransferase/cytidyltransferase family protein [Fimbriimonadaceae bacterium]|nr:adenylyltransferase/cytidyltransferase family protein [Fimbriimonadaceae bacterium]